MKRRKVQDDRASRMERVLQAIVIALKEPAGGDYWMAREIADEWGIYNDDLEGDRVLLRLAERALAR